MVGALLATLVALSGGAIAADEAPRPTPADPDGAVLDEAPLSRDLPSSRNVWSFLETAEPMTILDRIDGAGLHLGDPGRFSMHGASWTQNAFLLDGVDLTDPLVGGGPLLLPDIDVFEPVELASRPAPVEYGAPGVTMTLTPREPGRSWHATVQGYGLGAGLQRGGSSRPVPFIARFGSLTDASVVASGPIAGERLRLLLSGHFARGRRLERADPAPLESRLASGAAGLVFQPHDRDTLRLLVTAQAVERPLAARARYLGDPAKERADAFGGALRWTRSGQGATATGFAGFWSGRFEPTIDDHEASRPIERLLDGPVPTLVFPARSRRSTWTVGGSLAMHPSPLDGVSHAPRLGVAVRRAWAREQPGPADPIPETVDRLSARLWEYEWGGSDSRRHLLDLAAWAADRLTWGDRLSVEAGVRLERTTGAATGAGPGVSWTSLLPRLSARWRLTEAGRLTAFAGWGEYRHRLLLEHLAFGDPNGSWASVYGWTDANGDGLYEPAERGTLIARVGPGAAEGSLTSLDPGLRPPRTREVVGGIEATIGGGVVVRLVGVDRRERDLLESVNVGVPPSEYTVRYLPDPGGDIVGPQDDQLLPVFDRREESFALDRYLLTNPPGHTGLHQSVELRVEKPLGRRLAFLAGATTSRTEIRGGNRGFRVVENDQGVTGELFDNPNADTYSRGRGYFDRAFTIKLAAAWRPPGDWRLGLVARYQDGQPFSRLVIVPDLAQGPEAIPATTRGQHLGRIRGTDPEGRPLTAEGHRFTFTLTVDARIEKGLAVGPARLGLVAEVFNLLDTGNEVEEDPVWGPSFRVATAIQPPRVLRLGARLDF
ncbi:MAG: TonB-dependent receptor [Acidobacteria bacterium]|nr:TonB-dependent receptor [Acidobacteriota bacterium]